MSAFSDVDAAVDPSRLVRFLEESATGLAAMKRYMGATLAAHAGDGLVLDVGCGSGHDLAVLDGFSVAGLGVDPSGVMLDAARSVTAAPLLQAFGSPLPFRSGVFAGAWIERVLMHVSEPAVVLGEVVRCLRPGAVLTIFEPDWSSLTVNGRRLPTSWTTGARHPAMGSEVGALLEQLGCFVRDRVEERSWWTRPQFEALTGRALARAAGDVGLARWRRELDATEAFEACICKVLWVATTPTQPGLDTRVRRS